jgi:4-amino-4-deoxy-L-arabinose transferase-like glycosyltransferase
VIARRTLALAFAVGLLLRLVALGFVAHHLQDGDGASYDRMGLNLAQHGVVSVDLGPPLRPTMERAPMLPFVAAAIYRVAGHHYLPIQIFAALATTAACLLLALAMARIAPAAARWALWLLVLSPFDIGFSGAMLAEPLCTSFLALAFAAPLLWPRRGWAICGAALGGAALSRDIYLGLVPFVALLVIVAQRRQWRRGLARAALVVVGALIVVAPWSARNWRASGQLVPVSKGLMWINVWIGTWERNGDWEAVTLAARLPPESYHDEAERAAIAEAVTMSDPVERDARFHALALHNLRARPLAIFARWCVRWPRMWIGTRFDLFSFRPSWMARGRPLWIAFKLAMLALDVAALLLALAGLVLAWRHTRALLWFALPLAYQQLAYFPFHNVETRFTQPVFPFVLLFAALALVRIQSWARSSRSRSSL